MAHGVFRRPSPSIKQSVSSEAQERQEEGGLPDLKIRPYGVAGDWQSRRVGPGLRRHWKTHWCPPPAGLTRPQWHVRSAAVARCQSVAAPRWALTRCLNCLARSLATPLRDGGSEWHPRSAPGVLRGRRRPPALASLNKRASFGSHPFLRARFQSRVRGLGGVPCRGPVMAERMQHFNLPIHRQQSICSASELPPLIQASIRPRFVNCFNGCKAYGLSRLNGQQGADQPRSWK